MRDHRNDTIAVSVTVRHTRSDRVVEHTHEVVVTDAGGNQPEWNNRRIVAALDDATGRVCADFGVTTEQAERGHARDFRATAARTDAKVR